MKGLNLPILFLTLFLICGILLAPLAQFPLMITIVILGCCITIAFFSWLTAKRYSRILPSLPFYLSFFALGMLLAQLGQPKNIPSHFTNTSGFGQDSKITLHIKEVLKPSRYADRYIGEVRTINGHTASGKVLVYVSQDSLQKSDDTADKLWVDGVYYLNSLIKPVPKPKNPYQFDYAAFLKNQRVYGQLSLGPNELLLLDSSIKTPLGLATRLRKFLQQKLDRNNFTPDQWGVINALLLGQRQELSPEISNTYRDAGVIHILAVSGLHVGIVLLIFQFLLKPLGNTRRRRFLRSLLVIVGIWCFALITGLSPSILRAATMFTFLQIGLASNRKNGGMNGLIASALVLLVIDPSLIYQVGFQLSYLAVFFILWLQPELAALWKPRLRWVNYFWDITTVSLAAQLGVLPLSLFYFHQFPGLFLVANLGVLPLLGFILGLGLLLLILAAINSIPHFFAEAYGHLITWLNDFIGWIASFDALVIKHIYFSAASLGLAYLILLATILLFKRFNYNRILLFLSALLITVFTLVGEKMRVNTERLYVLYKSRKSILARQTADRLTFYSTDTLMDKTEKSIWNSFAENQQITSIKIEELQNIYQLKSQCLLVVDSLGVYDVPDLKPDYILLTQSPKLNLNRLIDAYPHVQVIADGNNYKSYVQRWKLTCEKSKIPFHSTYEQGFFKID